MGLIGITVIVAGRFIESECEGSECETARQIPHTVADANAAISLCANRSAWNLPFLHEGSGQDRHGLILRLRRKLENNSSSPSIIQTERGVGYVFTLPVEPL
jgi:hypothetical protein